MSDESKWIERAQSAEAAISTYRQGNERLKEKLRGMMETLGARERSDGVIDFDFDKLAARFSLEHALELRAALDRQHRISGAPGEKPRVVLKASAA